VGIENVFIFGYRTEQLAQFRAGYNPLDFYEVDAELRKAVDALVSGEFSAGDPSIFVNLHDSLIQSGDRYFVLADYRPYIQRQNKAAETFEDPAGWARKAVLTVARMGKFSSDRTIREYMRDIWQVKPLPIKPEFVNDLYY